MNTARVVVVDEDKNEALPLLAALGTLGIGAVYIVGDDVATLPKTKLRGIRTVFLDLNLNGQSEGKNFVPYAAKVLNESVDCASQSVGIVCWTKNNDDIGLLNDSLAKLGIRPAFVKSFENKTAAIADAATLLKELEAAISEDAGRSSLFQCETLAHDAITESSDSLLAMTTNEQNLLQVLASIATAAADGPIDSHEGAWTALRTGMSAFYSDSIATGSSAQGTGDSFSEPLHKEIVGRSKPTLEQRARLNSALLCADPSSALPGSVYLTETSSNDLAGIIRVGNLRKFVAEVFSRKDDKDSKDFLDKIVAAATPIFVEFTPACDHANRKAAVCRLLAGIAVDLSKTGLAEEKVTIPPACRLFAKETEPLWLNCDGTNSSPHRIIVSARCLVTASTEQLAGFKQLVRMRPVLVADLQAWFASHASRPGYLSIH